MVHKEGNGRFFMSSVKIGPKGQIVIPKEAREMFGFKPGDTIVLLADSERGIALQEIGQLQPVLRNVFQNAPSEKEGKA